MKKITKSLVITVCILCINTLVLSQENHATTAGTGSSRTERPIVENEPDPAKIIELNYEVIEKLGEKTRLSPHGLYTMFPASIIADGKESLGTETVNSYNETMKRHQSFLEKINRLIDEGTLSPGQFCAIEEGKNAYPSLNYCTLSLDSSKSLTELREFIQHAPKTPNIPQNPEKIPEIKNLMSTFSSLTGIPVQFGNISQENAKNVLSVLIQLAPKFKGTPVKYIRVGFYNLDDIDITLEGKWFTHTTMPIEEFIKPGSDNVSDFVKSLPRLEGKDSISESIIEIKNLIQEKPNLTSRTKDTLLTALKLLEEQANSVRFQSGFNESNRSIEETKRVTGWDIRYYGDNNKNTLSYIDLLAA